MAEEEMVIAKGILESIVEIGATYIERSNGIMGPAGRGWKEKSGNYTKFNVKVTEREGENPVIKHFVYDGIILPDSINNLVLISKGEGSPSQGEGRLKVSDLKLMREYK